MKKLNKILLDYLIEEEIGNSELIKNIDDLNDADNLENLEKILSDEQKRTEIDLKISKQISTQRPTSLEKQAGQAEVNRLTNKLNVIKKNTPTIKKTKDSLKNLSNNINNTMPKDTNKLGQLSITNSVSEGLTMKEGDSEIQQQQNANQMQEKPKKKFIVQFDKSTGKSFQVEFSERGFLVNNTRFSFEIIETALNKNFNIVLDGGNGMILDQVKMQTILKYKDRT